jgi:antirestriction protein ArdC
MNQTELRQQITNQIIEALKKGTPPWRRPWCSHKNSGHPVNVQSNRPYSGVNPLLLQIAAHRHGLRSKYWGTFNQWKALGGKIKPRPSDVPPGQWGTSIVFFKPVKKTEINKDTGEEEEVRFGFLRSYTVFNVDQVEGAHLDHLRVGDTPATSDFVDFEPAERAIMATGADIRFGGDRAFYRRPTPDGEGDFIQCPHKLQFTEEKEYYATMLHELTHWSEVRLDWKSSYAEGELRAEIAAAYMLAELNVPQSDDLSNHHAYLGHWLEALQNDPRFIFTCSTAASKAADFILSFSRAPVAEEPATEPDAVLAEY